MTRPGRVGRFDCTRPNPRNRRQLLTIRANSIRIQVPDAAFGFVAHPLPVRLNIRSQTLRPLVGVETRVDTWMHRRQTRKPRRDLDHRLVDQHRHRIQITSQSRKPKPLRLQRNRPTTRERIQNRRRSVREATVNLSLCFSQHDRIVGVLPHHQPFQNPEQPPSFCLLLIDRQRLIARRIVHQRSPNHSPRSRQRPPRPPQMQRRRMPLPNRLLPSRRQINRLQRQRHLNQLRPNPTHNPPRYPTDQKPTIEPQQSSISPNTSGHAARSAWVTSPLWRPRRCLSPSSRHQTEGRNHMATAESAAHQHLGATLPK